MRSENSKMRKLRRVKVIEVTCSLEEKQARAAFGLSLHASGCHTPAPQYFGGFKTPAGHASVNARSNKV